MRRLSVPVPVPVLVLVLAAGLAVGPPVQARALAEFTLCDTGHKVLVRADDDALAQRFAAQLAGRIAPLCRSFGTPLSFDSVQQFLHGQLDARQQALVAAGQVGLYVEAGR